MNAVDVGRVALVAGDVAALVELQAELLDQTVGLVGAGEGHGQRDELRGCASVPGFCSSLPS
ncbi:hypothetical protein [Streptomyces sp. WY228]|uniref:hypothetical protein n=1 Tax=Streptomyces sp. WY228 TaxID=2855836 RepID=UPI001C4EA71F|nr:hypothetical protein KV381_07900 [Streptomyces sp. WY228]